MGPGWSWSEPISGENFVMAEDDGKRSFAKHSGVNFLLSFITNRQDGLHFTPMVLRCAFAGKNQVEMLCKRHGTGAVNFIFWTIPALSVGFRIIA
jgi:hypothetical protein